MTRRIPDDTLLERARAGEPAAVEDLLRAHLPRIHAVCRRMCRDPGDAADAAQDAMMSIVRGLPSFDGRSTVSSWIYRVTTNACLDELRRRRRRPEPMEAGTVEPRVSAVATTSPEVQALRAEQRRVLTDALARLPEEYRVAVVLRDVADLDYATIAEITDVPLGTVRSRIARGRGRLAEVLRTSGTEPPHASSDHTERP